MAKKVSNRGIPLFTKPQPESKVEDIWHFPEARIAEESDEEATFTDSSKENSIMVRNDQKIQPSKKQGSKKVKVVLFPIIHDTNMKHIAY